MNSDLHAGGSYGRNGDRWAARVQELIDAYEAQSVLDYGCGQGALARAIGERVKEYDPAIPDKADAPAPADLVVCTDVLEHVELDCLSEVLDHLRQLSRKACFVVIATRPAKKVLADGRNATSSSTPTNSGARSWTRDFAPYTSNRKRVNSPPFSSRCRVAGTAPPCHNKALLTSLQISLPRGLNSTRYPLPSLALPILPAR
ncbi:MAG: class I SAM-dependent methyltransferase [Pseudomonadota bacterium]|nr:class I SAM-dependent methyltransferase [Pseudomonadota bacterium]